MLHFGKIPKKLVKFGENSAKIWKIFGQYCEILANFAKFWKKQKKVQQFLTKILRLESGAKEWHAASCLLASLFLRHCAPFVSALLAKFFRFT